MAALAAGWTPRSSYFRRGPGRRVEDGPPVIGGRRFAPRGLLGISVRQEFLDRGNPALNNQHWRGIDPPFGFPCVQVFAPAL